MAARRTDQFEISLVDGALLAYKNNDGTPFYSEKKFQDLLFQWITMGCGNFAICHHDYPF